MKIKQNNDNTLVTCDCIRPKLKQVWQGKCKQEYNKIINNVITGKNIFLDKLLLKYSFAV